MLKAPFNKNTLDRLPVKTHAVIERFELEIIDEHTKPLAHHVEKVNFAEDSDDDEEFKAISYEQYFLLSQLKPLLDSVIVFSKRCLAKMPDDDIVPFSLANDDFLGIETPINMGASNTLLSASLNVLGHASFDAFSKTIMAINDHARLLINEEDTAYLLGVITNCLEIIQDDLTTYKTLVCLKNAMREHIQAQPTPIAMRFWQQEDRYLPAKNALMNYLTTSKHLHIDTFKSRVQTYVDALDVGSRQKSNFTTAWNHLGAIPRDWQWARICEHYGPKVAASVATLN